MRKRSSRDGREALSVLAAYDGRSWGYVPLISRAAASKVCIASCVALAASSVTAPEKLCGKAQVMRSAFSELQDGRGGGKARRWRETSEFTAPSLGRVLGVRQSSSGVLSVNCDVFLSEDVEVAWLDRPGQERSLCSMMSV